MRQNKRFMQKETARSGRRGRNSARAIATSRRRGRGGKSGTNTGNKIPF